MNQFNDFSIQDEFLDESFNDGDGMFSGFGEPSPLNITPMEVDQDMHSEDSGSNFSSSRGDFSKPLAACNSIGAQMYKNIAENRPMNLFNNKYCCLKNLGDDIDFGVTEFPHLSTAVKDQSELCLNSIAKSFNLQYKNMHSQRS